MKRFMTAAFCLPMLLCAWQGAHAEWFEASTSQEGTVFSIDPDRIKAVADKVQVWLKGDHSRNRSERARSSMTLLSIDCSASTIRTLSESSYDSYGKTISSRSYPDIQVGYDPITPETVADAVSKLVCFTASEQ